jgi:hypothetical protein
MSCRNEIDVTAGEIITGRKINVLCMFLPIIEFPLKRKAAISPKVI